MDNLCDTPWTLADTLRYNLLAVVGEMYKNVSHATQFMETRSGQVIKLFELSGEMYWQLVFLDPYRSDGIVVAALQSAPVTLGPVALWDHDKPCLFSAKIYSAMSAH